LAHDGKYRPLQFAPTINKNTTEYNADGQWVDGDKIRFNNSRPEKIGGWTPRELNRRIKGVARDLKTFREINTVPHFVVGTHQRLELEQLGTLYDITPVVASAKVSNAFTTSASSTRVLVSADAHDRENGDFVALTSVDSSVGGIQFSSGQVFEVVSTPNANSFIVSVTTTAASDATGGGDATLNYLLGTGRQSNGVARGWGAGTWNTPGVNNGGWSEPRQGTIEEELRQWSLANWGEDALAVPRGGALYHWDATTSVTTRASAINTAPVSNNFMFVHPNRHVVLLGTIPQGGSTADPLQVRWSDQDNFRVYSASATNLAGGFRLRGGSFIVGAVNSKRESILFTDNTVFTMRPLNDANFVFGFDAVGTNAGLISQQAAVDVDGIVYWMSFNDFYVYDGRVRKLPCTVDDFVFEDINFNQKEKIFCGINKEFDEVIWLYQSNDAEARNGFDADVNKYVKYNFGTGSWDTGTINRVVWQDEGILEEVIAVNTSGQVFNQEQGNDAAGAGISSFIESSWFDLDEGTNMMLVDQFLPDFVRSGLLNFTITTRKWPQGEETVKGPFQITNATQFIDFRARGRQAKVRFSSSAVGSDWEIGKPQYRIKPDGER